MVSQLVRDGGLVAIDAGPLRRARQLEGLGFLGMTLQQPLGLNFSSAWKLINWGPSEARLYITGGSA